MSENGDVDVVMVMVMVMVSLDYLISTKIL